MCVKAMLIVTFDKLWQSLLTNPRQVSQLRSYVWMLSGRSLQTQVAPYIRCRYCMKCRRLLFHLWGQLRVHWPLEAHESWLHSLSQEYLHSLPQDTFKTFIAMRNLKSSIDTTWSQLRLDWNQNQNKQLQHRVQIEWNNLSLAPQPTLKSVGKSDLEWLKTQLGQFALRFEPELLNPIKNCGCKKNSSIFCMYLYWSFAKPESWPHSLHRSLHEPSSAHCGHSGLSLLSLLPLVPLVACHVTPATAVTQSIDLKHSLVSSILYLQQKIIAKVCFAQFSMSRLALGSPGCRRCRHHAPNIFKNLIMLYFWKAQGPRRSKLIFPTVKYTNTQIHQYKYTNTAYDEVPGKHMLYF